MTHTHRPVHTNTHKHTLQELNDGNKRWMKRFGSQVLALLLVVAFAICCLHYLVLLLYISVLKDYEGVCMCVFLGRVRGLG